MARPAPIDLDTEDETEHGLGGSPGALVPVGDDSPLKRAKVSPVSSLPSLESQQLVSLIQSTIHESVASSVASPLPHAKHRSSLVG